MKFASFLTFFVDFYKIQYITCKRKLIDDCKLNSKVKAIAYVGREYIPIHIFHIYFTILTKYGVRNHQCILFITD